MFNSTALAAGVNAHQTPDLSQISERTLRDIVQLYRHLDLAGVPPLREVMRELERRREEEEDNPTILVTVKRGREYWLLQFLCPWCHHVHTHDGGPISEPPDAGPRASHCTAPSTPGGYTLEIAEAA